MLFNRGHANILIYYNDVQLQFSYFSYLQKGKNAIEEKSYKYVFFTFLSSLYFFLFIL